MSYHGAMFTECYCTQFRRASNALTRVYDDALRPVGLRVTQFSLLRALDRLGSATTTELAAELALERTTVSRNAKLLVEARWVDVDDSDDKRERVLSLNRSGRKMIADATPHWARAQASVEQSTKELLGAPSSRRLLQTLQTVQEAADAARVDPQ